MSTNLVFIAVEMDKCSQKIEILWYQESKNTKSFPVILELKWVLKLSPPELMWE